MGPPAPARGGPTRSRRRPSPVLGNRAHLATPSDRTSTRTSQTSTRSCTTRDLSDVVLVGHSYGGMVIAGVAEHVPERIVELVYLDADVPLEGESLMDHVPADERAGYEEAARVRGDGWRVPPPSPSPCRRTPGRGRGSSRGWRRTPWRR